MTEEGARFDPDDEAALARFVDDLREIHADALVAVAVTGEAASSTYRPRRTPLQTVVVLQEVTPAKLRATRPSLRRWARRRIPTPLFLDRVYIEGALDTFPLEFLEMAEHHAVLCGDPDLFTGIRIDRAALRLQVEEQLRGKMLHLWEAYLECGGRRRDLKRLLQEPLPGFELALRGLLRLREWETSGEASGLAGARPAGVALVDAVAAELDLELPTFRRLENARVEAPRLDGDLDDLDEAFLIELRRIVRTIDGLPERVGPDGR